MATELVNSICLGIHASLLACGMVGGGVLFIWCGYELFFKP